MKTFQSTKPMHFIFGIGATQRAVPLIKGSMNVTRVAILTDKFLAESGLAQKVADIFTAGGLEVAIFSDVVPNPTLAGVEAASAFLVANKSQAVIGLGGGSSMDTAKIAAGLLSNPPPAIQYVNKLLKNASPIPIITMPTTAGTGAESTAGGIVMNEETHEKGAIAAVGLTPLMTIIDPEYHLGMPPSLTAATGLDALVHAIEAFTSKMACPLADLYCREAIKLIAQNLRTACANGADLDARYNMAFAAWLAGASLGPSNTGAVHAFAYPLEGRFKIAHGNANAAMLVAVMRHSAIGNIPKFKEIAVLLGEDITGLSDRDAAFKAAEAVDALCKDLKVPKLKELGVKEEDFESLTAGALTYKRLIDPNPMPINAKEGMEIYRASF